MGPFQRGAEKLRVPLAASLFGPVPLLGDQALHELGPFPLVGLHALACQQLADLRSCWSGSLGAVASNNPIETLAESGRHAQKIISAGGGCVVSGTYADRS